MNLQTETKTFIVINHYNLEKFIEHHTGKKYNILARQEYGNGGYHTFDISGKLDDFEKEDYEEFVLSGEGSFILTSILEGLCRDGKINSGTYLLETTW